MLRGFMSGVLRSKTPCLGATVAASGGHGEARKGSQIAPKGVADLLLEGREAAAAQGLKAMRCGGTPGKPGFRHSRKCAQIMLCTQKHDTTHHAPPFAFSAWAAASGWHN
jgi:hypothetical protein